MVFSYKVLCSRHLCMYAALDLKGWKNKKKLRVIWSCFRVVTFIIGTSICILYREKMLLFLMTLKRHCRWNRKNKKQRVTVCGVQKTLNNNSNKKYERKDMNKTAKRKKESITLAIVIMDHQRGNWRYICF